MEEERTSGDATVIMVRIAFGSVGTFVVPSPFGGIQQQQWAFGPSSGLGMWGQVRRRRRPPLSVVVVEVVEWFQRAAFNTDV